MFISVVSLIDSEMLEIFDDNVDVNSNNNNDNTDNNTWLLLLLQ